MHIDRKHLLDTLLFPLAVVAFAESTYRRAISEAQFPDPKLFVDLGRVLQKTGRSSEAQDVYRGPRCLSRALGLF